MFKQTPPPALAHHVVGLQAVGIDRSAVFLDGLDKLDTLILVPLDSVVVVIDEDSLRPAFTRHLEGGGYEGIVAIVVAAESRNDVVVLAVGRMIAVVARTDSLVHHVNHLDFGVMFLDRIEPGCNRLPGFVDAEAIKPARILGAPHQGVELEMPTVILCPVIGGIAGAPVVTATGTLDGAPLTAVFGRSLVPKLGKLVIRTRSSARLSDVTDELRGAIGNAGTRERESRCRKSHGSNPCCC